MATADSHPRVSVVVPNYNHESFLASRLQSVFDQTWQDFEVIYLDDASTDGSNAVAEEFTADPRFRMVINEENSGSPFVQWNRGVSLARGDLVWIAESDDLAEPDLLHRLVAALDANPHGGLAYCKSQPIDSQGKFLASNLVWPDPAEASHWQGDYVNDGRDEIRRFMVLRCTIPNASAVVFRKQVYDDAGGAPLDYSYAGDWLTWLKILLRSDICYVDSPLNYHRKHDSTITAGAALDGRWAEECYRILSFLMGELEIPHLQLERVRDRLMVKWMASWVHPDCQIDGPRQDQIYRAALEADPDLLKRSGRNIMRTQFFARCRLVADLVKRRWIGPKQTGQ